jgi:hypothetical protein
VTTPEGATVTGTTVLPDIRGAEPTPQFESFNRDRDSAFVSWSEAPGAVRYALRIDSPYGAFTQFVDSLEYLVSGRLRNSGLAGLPNVFVPGFTQLLTVAAVDTNYFDYFRTKSDPFTGAGQINHLQGGIGVFGAVALLTTRTLTVRADEDDPLEGTLDLRTPDSGTPPRLQLYVIAREGGITRFSGRQLGTGNPTPPGLLGTSTNTTQYTIALLAGQSARDTALVLDLREEPSGDLAGRVRETGRAVRYGRTR